MVSMPTAMRSGGNRFFFFSNEGNEPPHIHVESAEKYAKFWLDPVSLARSVGFRSHELSQLSRIVTENQQVFTERCYEFFDR